MVRQIHRDLIAYSEFNYELIKFRDANSPIRAFSKAVNFRLNVSLEGGDMGRLENFDIRENRGILTPDRR